MNEKINLSSKKEPDSVFKKDEVFDATEELSNLKKNYHGRVGLKQLEKFKKKLNFHELGFSSIEVKLFDLIKKKPDSSINDLNNLIKNDIKKYALTKEQINIIFSIFDKFKKKNKIIKEVINNNTENEEINGKILYKKLFKRNPVDKVRVIVRSMTINFCPKNIDDYAYLIDNAFLEGREISKNDKEIAKEFGGRILLGTLLKGSDGILVIINPYFFDKKIEDLSNVLEHEEQHAFNELKVDAYNFDTDYLLDKINKIEKKTGTKISEELLSFLIRNHDIEYMVKDEISAYSRERSSTKKISKILLKKETIYDVGFDYNKKESNSNDEFDKKYMKFVKNAVISFHDLLKYGLTHEKVQNLLFNRPITKWPRVVERITGIKKNYIKKKKDENRYISKVINNQK